MDIDTTDKTLGNNILTDTELLQREKDLAQLIPVLAHGLLRKIHERGYAREIKVRALASDRWGVACDKNNFTGIPNIVLYPRESLKDDIHLVNARLRHEIGNLNYPLESELNKLKEWCKENNIAPILLTTLVEAVHEASVNLLEMRNSFSDNPAENFVEFYRKEVNTQKISDEISKHSPYKQAIDLSLLYCLSVGKIIPETHFTDALSSSDQAVQDCFDRSYLLMLDQALKTGVPRVQVHLVREFLWPKLSHLVGLQKPHDLEGAVQKTIQEQIDKVRKDLISVMERTEELNNNEEELSNGNQFDKKAQERLSDMMRDNDNKTVQGKPKQQVVEKKENTSRLKIEPEELKEREKTEESLSQFFQDRIDTIKEEFENLKKEHESINGEDRASKEEQESINGEDRASKEDNESINGEDRASKESQESINGEDRASKEEQESINGEDRASKESQESINGEDRASKEDNESLNGEDRASKEDNESINGEDRASKEDNESINGEDRASKEDNESINGEDRASKEDNESINGEDRDREKSFEEQTPENYDMRPNDLSFDVNQFKEPNDYLAQKLEELDNKKNADNKGQDYSEKPQDNGDIQNGSQDNERNDYGQSNKQEESQESKEMQDIAAEAQTLHEEVKDVLEEKKIGELDENEKEQLQNMDRSLQEINDCLKEYLNKEDLGKQGESCDERDDKNEGDNELNDQGIEEEEAEGEEMQYNINEVGINEDELSESQKEILNKLRESLKSTSCVYRKMMRMVMRSYQNKNPNFTDKLFQRIKEKRLDVPAFTIYASKAGNSFLSNQLEFKGESIMDDNFMVNFQLPKPLSKFWYKGGNGKKSVPVKDGEIEWGYFYRMGMPAIWKSTGKAVRKGLVFDRINNYGQHDPQKYYYLWEIMGLKGPDNTDLSFNENNEDNEQIDSIEENQNNSQDDNIEEGAQENEERENDQSQQNSGEEGSQSSGEEGSQSSGEQGSQSSSEQGSQSSSEQGSQSSSEQGSQSGSEQGSQSGSEQGSQSGSEQGSQSGGEQGSQSSSEQGSQSSSEQGSQSGGEQGSQSSSEQGSQSGSEQGSQSGGEQGSQSGGEQGSQSSSEQGSQSSSEQGSQSSSEQGSQNSSEQGSQSGSEQGSMDGVSENNIRNLDKSGLFNKNGADHKTDLGENKMDKQSLTNKLKDLVEDIEEILDDNSKGIDAQEKDSLGSQLSEIKQSLEKNLSSKELKDLMNQLMDVLSKLDKRSKEDTSSKDDQNKGYKGKSRSNESSGEGSSESSGEGSSESSGEGSSESSGEGSSESSGEGSSESSGEGSSESSGEGSSESSGEGSSESSGEGSSESSGEVADSLENASSSHEFKKGGGTNRTELSELFKSPDKELLKELDQTQDMLSSKFSKEDKTGQRSVQEIDINDLNEKDISDIDLNNDELKNELDNIKREQEKRVTEMYREMSGLNGKALDLYVRYMESMKDFIDDLTDFFMTRFNLDQKYLYESNQRRGARLQKGYLRNIIGVKRGQTLIHPRSFERKRPPRNPRFVWSLIIDNSGSCNGEIIEQEKRLAIALLEVAKRLDIPLEILAFGSKYEYVFLKNFDQDIKGEDLEYIVLLKADKGTPDVVTLDAACGSVENYINQFNRSYNFVYFMTDGASGSGSIKNVIERYRRDMVITGIGLDRAAYTIKYTWGKNAVSVPDVKDLSEKFICHIEDQIEQTFD